MYVKNPAVAGFQSLFYWMYVKNLDLSITYLQLTIVVSILVLLDVCKERDGNHDGKINPWAFQSLFYWMYVKNSQPD